LQKLYAMSLKSESPLVRFEAIHNLKNDDSILNDLQQQLSELKNVEKDESVLELLLKF